MKIKFFICPDFNFFNVFESNISKFFILLFSISTLFIIVLFTNKLVSLISFEKYELKFFLLKSLVDKSPDINKFYSPRSSLRAI